MTNTSLQWQCWLHRAALVSAVVSVVFLWTTGNMFWLLGTMVLPAACLTASTLLAVGHMPALGVTWIYAKLSTQNKMHSSSVEMFILSKLAIVQHRHVLLALSYCSIHHVNESVSQKNTLIQTLNDSGCLQEGSGFISNIPHIQSSSDEDEYIIHYTGNEEDQRILVGKVFRCKYCGAKVNLQGEAIVKG